MDTTTVLIIIIAILVVIVIAMAAMMAGRRRRTEELKGTFGPEYEHAVDQYGDQRAAEEKLEERQSRVEALNIHPLQPAERDRFAEEWRQTQAEFVDAPERAVADADRLVGQVMQARGYPLGDFDQRAADISVDHADVVTHYRAAHEIALRQKSGQATTEDLRQAMVHYRALFEDLLQGDGAGAASDDRARAREDTTRESSQ